MAAAEQPPLSRSGAAAAPASAAQQPPAPQPSGQQASAQHHESQQPATQWKIQPLPGDPPLTLYRDKRVVLLPAGTEVDRYGEPTGNVTYTAGTDYKHRSLPAEWRDLPYHAYRLQRPLEALTGLAVPWFEQPGGGTAFILPRSTAELMADGSLVEVEGAAAPDGG